MDRVVIVGGGLAGIRSAEALRSKGYAGELTLVSAERHRPYDRPPLSKAVLAGDQDDTTVDVGWDALDCTLRLGARATGLDLAEAGGVVRTTTGELPFDGLVIATGATPVTLPGDGPARVLRTIDDSLSLRSTLVEGARIVIVGAGWIGAEVATAAAKKGCTVIVVEAADTPLANAVGPEIGAHTARWYAEAGVELRTGVKVAAVEHGGLALADGGRIDADEILVGIGVRPEVGWLEGSGIELDGGVVTDAALRTNRPDVVAVGDCAAWWSRRYGRRLLVEHWDTALNAPSVAAATLLGQEAEYEAVPYFWSEQFDRMVQYAGHVSHPTNPPRPTSRPVADRMIYRGDPAAPKWAACWLNGDRLEAVLTVNRPRDLLQGRRIIAQRASVDPEAIADPEFPLRNAMRN